VGFISWICVGQALINTGDINFQPPHSDLISVQVQNSEAFAIINRSYFRLDWDSNLEGGKPRKVDCYALKSALILRLLKSVEGREF
jgi:hypothetical protein